MKDRTFKWLSKFFITLGIVYWAILIVAATTGCNTLEVQRKSLQPEFDEEYTLSLDPMDKTQWHEREQFLQHFDY